MRDGKSKTVQRAKAPTRRPVEWTEDDDTEIGTMRLLRGVAITLLLLALSGGGLYAVATFVHGAGPVTVNPVKLVAASRGTANYKPMSRPMALPPFAFVDEDGQRAGVNDFAGRVVLLNLWATWCAPCVKEMPSLDRLQARLGGKDFQVVAISVDKGARAVVEPFLERLGVTHLPVYLDPGSVSLRTLGVSGLPTSLLIDREGRAVGAVEGDAEWDAPDSLALIQRLIGTGGGGPEGRQGGLIRT